MGDQKLLEELEKRMKLFHHLLFFKECYEKIKDYPDYSFHRILEMLKCSDSNGKKIIDDLEGHYGKKLIDRSRSRTYTQKLLPDAEPIYEIAKNISDNFNEHSSPCQSAELVVTASNFIVRGFLAPILKEYLVITNRSSKAARVKLKLLENEDPRSLEKDIATGDAELGISVYQDHFSRLKVEDIKVPVSLALLSRREEESSAQLVEAAEIETLRGQTVVITTFDEPYIVNVLYDIVKNIIIVRNYSSVYSMVLQDIGMGVVLHSPLFVQSRDLVARRLHGAEDRHRRILIYMYRDRPLSEAAERFIQVIKEFVSNAPVMPW